MQKKKQIKGKEHRVEIVTELKKKVQDAKSIVFTDYKGLKANQLSALRLKLQENGAEARVEKNTLLNLAIEKDAAKEDLVSNTLAVFSYQDALAAIKTLFDFAKENSDLPVIKGGIVDGSYTSATQIELLSKLPSKEELLSRVVGGMKSPINKFVGVLNGVQRNFVGVLAAVAKEKEKN